MNTIWKEYGIIAVLIVIAVGGYLIVDRNKEDILAYSLDAIGTRLVALVDDDVSKRRIALAFDSFKRRVANDEVSSEQVELVAANILNLSTSGARITPEDAELILNLNEEALLADLPVPDPASHSASEPELPSAPTTPPTPDAAAPDRPPPAVKINSRALASRIEAMVDVAESMERTVPADSVIGKFMVFSPENGLHLEIDPESGRRGIRIDIESIQAAVETAVQDAKTGSNASTASGAETMVRVDETMAEQHAAWTTFLERRRREMADFEQTVDVRSAELNRTMERLERLASLQEKGLYAPFDTTRFGRGMDELMKRLRRQAVQGAMSETPPTDFDSR